MGTKGNGISACHHERSGASAFLHIRSTRLLSQSFHRKSLNYNVGCAGSCQIVPDRRGRGTTLLSCRAMRIHRKLVP